MKVYKAITAVQADLAKEGISKSRKNAQQGYSFRGIDDVYNALAPVLAMHGLCILPRILTRQVVERESQRGGVLFYVTVEAEFDFVCSEDGSKHTVRTFGEAMDSGDKATNKAMSAAYKYAAMQAFAIPTEGDNDADAVTHAVKPAAIPASAKSVAKSAWDELPVSKKRHLSEIAADVVELLAIEKAIMANELIGAAGLDTDEKAALWSLFDSKQRAALKAAKAPVTA